MAEERIDRARKMLCRILFRIVVKGGDSRCIHAAVALAEIIY